jgi:hypothetical protein
MRIERWAALERNARYVPLEPHRSTQLLSNLPPVRHARLLAHAGV